MKRLGLLLLIPALGLALAALLVGSTRTQHARMSDDGRRAFETHVASVVRLAREAARQGAVAVDLLYVLVEDELAAAVALQAHLGPDEASEGDLAVWVARGDDGAFAGRWGDVPEALRPALVTEVLGAAEGELVDSGAARRAGLACARFDRWGRAQIGCQELARMDELRREIGLGPLLRGIAGQDVVYVVVQDETGLLAASPGAPGLSTWSHDPFLAGARAAAGVTFRRTASGGRPLLEGVGPFPLPDGTTAVLRVGVDATSLADLEQRVAARTRVLYAVAALVFVLALSVAAVLALLERRRREAERREAEQAHWRAIGQMAATVAHEVRNPLNAVQMAAQRLQRELTVPAEERADFEELTGVLRLQADRVERVVTEFLELGRPLVLELASAPAAEIVDEALLPLRLRADAAGQRLEVVNRCDREVRVDRRRFGQIVANLVGNALDACGPAGRVLVSAACTTGGLELVIDDDGPGMDAETLERVQAPFVSTKANGTGLGLPLARRLVEAHDGRLELVSTPGEGTRARILLPRRREERP